VVVVSFLVEVESLVVFLWTVTTGVKVEVYLVTVDTWSRLEQ
jgi:hypothetical protein